MSKSAGSYQCVWVKNNENYTTSLIASGSLMQRYSGSYASPTIPDEYDFTKTKPVLQVLFSGADPDEDDQTLAGLILNLGTKWYANDEEITFANNNLSAATSQFEAGTFERIPANTDNTYPFGGIRFLKNLVSGAMGTGVVIRNLLAFTTSGGQPMSRQQVFTVDIKRFSGDGYEADIYTDTTLALDSTRTSTLLRVRLWKGAVKEFDSRGVNQDKTIRWYAYDTASGDWTEIAAQSENGQVLFGYNGNHELTVGCDAVPTYLDVMCAVFEGSNSTETDYRKALATDITTVNDQTDSLVIEPNTTPADRVLHRGDTTPDGVLFAPKVIDTKTNMQMTGFRFRFICVSPAGTILNGTSAQGLGYDSPDYGVVGTPDNTELLETYKVPRSMFEAIDDGPTVIIYAEKST